MELFNYRFKLLDADSNPYQLRIEQLTSCKIVYKKAGTVDSFTETTDFNIDEENDAIWVRLPAWGLTEVVINIQMKPLRVVCTPVVTFNLEPYTTFFETKATPVPVNSLQGHSPRIIDGYWFQYNDLLGAFENTGIKAESAVITPGTVVDVIEPDNPNPISSGGVYNFYNTQQQTNNNLHQSITYLSQEINALKGTRTRIKLNNTIYSPDNTGLIDLGEMQNSVLDTYMLTRTTEINGVIYPKGTQYDRNNTIYSTDAFYRYRMSTAIDTQSLTDRYYALVEFGSGCTLTVTWTIYNTSRTGVIYCVRNGYEWEFYCTTPEIAQAFWIYRYSHVTTPILVTSVSSQMSYGCEVNITSDIPLTVRNVPWGADNSKFQKIKPFLTEYTEDTIEISSNTYETSVEDLTITKFITTVGGEIDFTITEELDRAVSLDFACSVDNTTIKITDGSFTSESDELDAGTTATFIFNSPDNYYWEYGTASVTNVKDVKVDNLSVVAGQTAYISSLTTTQVNTLKAIFTV